MFFSRTLPHPNFCCCFLAGTPNPSGFDYTDLLSLTLLGLTNIPSAHESGVCVGRGRAHRVGKTIAPKGAGASRQSRSGPENVHGGAKKETKARDYKDGVERFRHVTTKGRSLTPTLFSISYLYRKA